jgi:hypothetical protein
MHEALKTCEHLHTKFSNIIGAEVKRIHKEKPEKGVSAAELELEKLKIYEAGDEQPIQSRALEEYDLAFEQLISDSEEEKMDGDE